MVEVHFLDWEKVSLIAIGGSGISEIQFLDWEKVNLIAIGGSEIS